MKAFEVVSARQQILNIREFEFATTMRVLKAYPEDKMDMRPADKSRSARELIATLIGEQYVCRAAMRGEDLYAHRSKGWPDSLKDMLEMFDQIHNEVQEIIARAADAEMDRVVDFNGHQLRVLDVLWLELHDQIHHRGQFSVYLRLVGAKVPSIYGPTADEPVRTEH